MSFFIFNGTDSRDLGLIVTSPICRPSWTEERSEIIVPGRSRKIYKPSGVYANAELTVSTVISDTSRIHEIYAALSGSGRLILSCEPSVYIDCTVTSLVPESVALSMAELPVTFDCAPFAYAVDPTVIPLTKEPQSIWYPGSIFGEPMIRFRTPRDEDTILMGDIDGDGKITAVDASMVLQEYIRLAGGGEGTFTEEQRRAADMDGDGHITAADASEILTLYTKQSAYPTEAVATQVIITVNDSQLIVGLPGTVVGQGYEVTVDCAEKLIYYTDGDGRHCNIMQYSYGELPRLSVGENIISYSGDVNVTLEMNERWL